MAETLTQLAIKASGGSLSQVEYQLSQGANISFADWLVLRAWHHMWLNRSYDGSLEYMKLQRRAYNLAYEYFPDGIRRIDQALEAAGVFENNN